MTKYSRVVVSLGYPADTRSRDIILLEHETTTLLGDAAEEMTRLELDSKLSKTEMVSRDFQLSDILRALTVEAGKEGCAPEKNVDKPSTLSVLNDALECL